MDVPPVPPKAPTWPLGVVGIDRAPFEQFLVYEALLLDTRRFREWMDLFTEDGTYWVPAVPDQKSPYSEASLFYDDRDLMRTRIERLYHPQIHIQSPPSRTAHLISNLIVDAADEAAGHYTVSSTVLMVEYRDDKQRIFAGRQHHTLHCQPAGGFKIAHKRVDLINCDGAFEAMAVPI